MAKEWKFLVRKLKGALGQTDYEKKTITIDKKAHQTKNRKARVPNKDGRENLAITIKHELLHKQHPEWSEKKVEKEARNWKKEATPKEKKRLYAKL